MMALPLTGHDLLPRLVNAGIWLSVGTLIGAIHFLSLQWNVRLLAADRALAPALAVQLARFTLTAGLMFVIASRFGAFQLLIASLGILAARTAIVRFG